MEKGSVDSEEEGERGGEKEQSRLEKHGRYAIIALDYTLCLVKNPETIKTPSVKQYSVSILLHTKKKITVRTGNLQIQNPYDALTPAPKGGLESENEEAVQPSP